VKRLAGAILTFALLAGASALAIYRLDDRELMVSPPEAVAEGFFRAVVTHRPDQACAYLLQRTGPETIVSLQQSIESRFGRINDVKTETVSRTDERAVVSVELRSSQAGGAGEVTVAWNGEEWKVVQSTFP
jgi:hypothetical protein